MARLAISPLAEADIDDARRFTRARFGPAKADEYRGLIGSALKRLAENERSPLRAGVRIGRYVLLERRQYCSGAVFAAVDVKLQRRVEVEFYPNVQPGAVFEAIVAALAHAHDHDVVHGRFQSSAVYIGEDDEVTVGNLQLVGSSACVRARTSLHKIVFEGETKSLRFLIATTKSRHTVPHRQPRRPNRLAARAQK